MVAKVPTLVTYSEVVLNHSNIVRILHVILNAVYKSKREIEVAYELLPNGELLDILFYTGRMDCEGVL